MEYPDAGRFRKRKTYLKDLAGKEFLLQGPYYVIPSLYCNAEKSIE